MQTAILLKWWSAKNGCSSMGLMPPNNSRISLASDFRKDDWLRLVDDHSLAVTPRMLVQKYRYNLVGLREKTSWKKV